MLITPPDMLLCCESSAYCTTSFLKCSLIEIDRLKLADCLLITIACLPQQRDMKVSDIVH